MASETSKVTVKMPDGKPFSFNAPAGASDEDIFAYAEQNYRSQEAISRQEGADSSWRGGLSVLQGPTFGFGDEIVGGINSVKSLWNGESVAENYKRGRDFARGAAKQEETENPWMTNITRMASTGLLGPLAAGRSATAAASTGIAAAAGSMALQGLKFGAIQGAGDSTADSASGVAMDALGGGATGMVLTPVLGGGASVLGAVGKRATPTVLDATGRVIDSMGGGGGWFRDKVSAAASTFANSQAQAKVAEALARDRAGSGKVFAQGADPTQSLINRIDRRGPRGSIATAGGTATQGLLDTVAVIPGETGQALSQYQRWVQAGRGKAMAQSADTALGTNGAKYSTTVEALDTLRKQASKPYYDQLDSLMVRVDDDLANLLRRTKDTHGEAQTNFTRGSLKGETIDLSSLQPGDVVPFTVLDTLKRTLFDVADAAKVQGKKDGARLLDQSRRDLINYLDNAAPKDNAGASVYKLARDAYAGPSEMISAAELGRKAMRGDITEIGKEMGGFTASETEAFRVGALQALREKTGTQAGQTSLLKMWMEPATQERLKTMFGKTYDYRRFARDVAAEEKLNPILRLGTRGSTTANKIMGAGDLDVAPALDAATFVGSAASGNPTGMLASGARILNRVQTPEPVRDQMGRILLSQGDEAKANLLRMQELTKRINASRAVKQQFYGGAGAINSAVFTANSPVPPGLFQSILGDPAQ